MFFNAAEIFIAIALELAIFYGSSWIFDKRNKDEPLTAENGSSNACWAMIIAISSFPILIAIGYFMHRCGWQIG